MDGLKPCPFCGDTRVTIEDNSDACTGEEDWIILCEGCQSAFISSNDGLPCTKTELIERWQRRARQ